MVADGEGRGRQAGMKPSVNSNTRTQTAPDPAKLARDLDRIAVPAGKSAKRSNTIALIRQFVASAPYTDDAAERELRSRMKAELSALAENQWSPLLTHKERKSC